MRIHGARLILAISFAIAVPAGAASAPRHRAAAPVFRGRAEVTRVFLVILENEDVTAALRQPFLSRLATTGALLRQYKALANISQPNYMALSAGDTLGVNDDNHYSIDARNLTDLLDENRVPWKVYAENYPGNCFLFDFYGTVADGMYVRRHVTFLNFRNVQNTPSRCARIVNSTQFDIDVATKSVPKFAMYIPNNRNNGHDTDIATADRWLESRFGSLINDPTFMNGTLFIVIFDEGGQTNTIYASLNGAGIQRGATSDTRYTHYNLLRTIEEILHLGTLGRQDAAAAAIEGIWRR